MEDFQFIDGTINSPKGFFASGVSCGIKKTGDFDLALVVSDPPAVAAGVFTKNIVKGHSLQRTMDLIGKSPCCAVIINSGNANACIGPKGTADASQIAEVLSECLSCKPENILTASTGVIGVPLPMDNVIKGTYKAFSCLSDDSGQGHLAELAIMTTDTVPKERCISYMSEGKEITVSGMAKGSGMIHPNMATMIGVITTDCAISSDSLNKALKYVVNRSFNRISVDGDTSVCDMVVMLANGKAGNTLVTENDSHEYNRFVKALEMICIDLAKEVAADGEGATKLIEVNVTGAPSDEDANKITRAICNSPLVKTAFFGEDANWGRILTAAGYSGAVFDPDKCSISIGSIPVFSSGIAVDFDEDHVKSILDMDEIKVNMDLSQGNGSDTMWTCDFSYDYVKINGSYRT